MTDWRVPVPDELVRQLEAMLDAASSEYVEFVVGFFDGLKVEIYANEHPPPHFHVAYQNEENSFRISDGRPLHDVGLDRYHRQIRKWHRENRSRLIEIWNAMRPADCPVGRFVE